ncbi:MAG: divalent metal ion transporter [Lentisphaerae bacterium GWF2_52_8]|nr:MAG: divalent metal ion transporter [Lentisphaerae bacterium GWF2_52_8]
MLKRFEIMNGTIMPCERGDSPLLVFETPDDTEKELIRRLGIDDHTLNSSLDPDEISRLEFEDEYIGIILKRPKNYSSQEQLMFRVSSMGVFLFKDRMVIIVSDNLPVFAGKQFQKVNSMNELLLKMIYSSITHFLDHLRVINMISNEIEQKVNSSMENKYLLHMFTLEKSLVYYLNSINSNGMLLEKLKNNSTKMTFTPDHLELLDDIMIENLQCYKQAEIYSDILASMMDARASIVNNNLNVLMKTLAQITLGVMVPTFVVSLFSMNVDFPYQHSGYYTFFVIIVVSLISPIGLMLFFKYKRW